MTGIKGAVATFCGALFVVVAAILALGSTATAAPSPAVPYSSSGAPTHTVAPPSSSSGAGGIATCRITGGSAVPGGSLTIACSGFASSERAAAQAAAAAPDAASTQICVGLDGRGDDLGSGPTDQAGDFGTTVTLPEDISTGRHTMYVAPCAGGGPEATISFDVASSGSGGGTAYTGVAVAGFGLLGVLLLVGGGALMYAGRRRRGRRAV